MDFNEVRCEKWFCMVDTEESRAAGCCVYLNIYVCIVYLLYSKVVSKHQHVATCWLRRGGLPGLEQCRLWLHVLSICSRLLFLQSWCWFYGVFPYKMCFFRSRLHIMFSDAIDHWMFWQCPNVSFFRQIWRKNQQSPVIYSVSIWHDLPCMLFGGVWLGASCCGKDQLRRIEMCASARNISCVAPRCVQLQRTSVA